MRPDGPIRVLIISDLIVLRRVLALQLAAARDIHPVTCGGETNEVRDHLIHQHPEVIVLDLGITRSDPLVMLHKLRTHYPVPVFVLAEPKGDGRDRAIRAVGLGALEFIPKPPPRDRAALTEHANDLLLKIRIAVIQARPTPRMVAAPGQPLSFRAVGMDPRQHVIAVGASTGGPEALATLLQRCPPDSPPIVIVQHMPVGFTKAFADRLSGSCAVRVAEAEDGEPLTVGCALIARGDTHLTVRAAGSGWIVRYADQTPVNRHCPSVDVLFDSVALTVGTSAVGVLMTGMGRDGADGLLGLRQAGAVTVAQDKNSSVVFGMPKEAIDIDAAMYIGAPQDIPTIIWRALRDRDRRRTRASAERLP